MVEIGLSRWILERDQTLAETVHGPSAAVKAKFEYNFPNHVQLVTQFP